MPDLDASYLDEAEQCQDVLLMKASCCIRGTTSHHGRTLLNAQPGENNASCNGR